ncbi:MULTISPECIES: NUDIX hydrolase [Micrococcales]|uniref:NUDIX hydrolase n=1 Tax=Micrococcales TaxID=85006 RepID=UPI000689A03F|nr:CoA pyrophosphatase [Curtobacterium sp. S6]
MAPDETDRRALDDLRELAARGSEIVMDDREPWRIGGIDPETVRDAAVLILFGVLDDAPATSRPGAAGAVGDDLDVLIVVRSDSLRQHAGQPAFPGGKVDPEDRESEDPFVEAALREAVEETGLDRSGVTVLGRLAPVPLPVSNFMVTPVLGWWVSPSPVEVVDAAESAQVFRVPVRDLTNAEHRYYATITRGPSTYKSPAFEVHSADGPVTIWGFTGVVLDRVLHELGWDEPWDRQRKKPAPI